MDYLRDYMQKMNNPDYLHTISLTELYDTVYQPRAQVIDGLLCSGAYLFAGAPKVGKSFFMAQLGYHVSGGIPLWEYPVHKGSVLYLALEDDYARLQKRLSQMFGMDSIDDFHFATHVKNVSEGLDGQLKKFVSEHPDTRLIIIDTLQKVREVGGEKYSYASDYEIVTKLKQFADHHNVCIILVHHTRKQTADDSFDTISGTNGLLGAAELIDGLDRMDIQPNVLTRKLNVGADRLWNEYHIRYESNRTHAGRNIKLTLDVSEA